MAQRESSNRKLTPLETLIMNDSVDLFIGLA